MALQVPTVPTVTVTAGSPTVLAFAAAPPATVVAGAAFSARVVARDVYGNVVPAGSTPPAVSLANSAVPLFGTAVTTTANGATTFGSLSVHAAGTYALTAAAFGLTVTSGAVVVTPGATAGLAFSTQPGTGLAGTLPAVTVAVADAYGNAIPGATPDLTLSLDGATATLTGTTTATAVAGVATFAAPVLTRAGTYRFHVASTGGVTGDSAPFAVVAGPAAQLAFAGVPSKPPPTCPPHPWPSPSKTSTATPA